MLWAIIASAGENGTTKKIPGENFLAAIPITLIIIAVVWNSRKKAKAKANAPQRPGTSAGTPRPQQKARPAASSSASPRAAVGRSRNRDPRADNPAPLDLITGDFFVKCLLVYRQLPPPGPAFLNEFLHGDPTGWSEEWDEARGVGLTGEAIGISVGKLQQLLDGLAREGLPAPVIQAAEEAVKVNLTALCVHHAEVLLQDRPDLRDRLAEDGDESFPGWADDPSHDAVAFLLREEVSPFDAAMFIKGTFLERPGDCVRAVASGVEAAATTLTKMPVDELANLARMMPGTLYAMQHQARRMLAAFDTLKRFPPPPGA